MQCELFNVLKRKCELLVALSYQYSSEGEQCGQFVRRYLAHDSSCTREI